MKKRKTQSLAPHVAPASQAADTSLKQRWKLIKDRLADWQERINRKGRERLTIMVIPHTEKQILNFHLSVFTISGIVGIVVLVMTISVVSLVGKSGEDLTHYGMGLDNKQFKLQSLKMAQEMVPLHEIINRYANTISQLHVKLDGDRNDQARGGVSQALMDKEIAGLRKLIDSCMANRSNCDQERTREMLRRAIFLSKQDNERLRHAITLSDKILAELRTREKQNLLKHTPSIWPTRGHLLAGYGRQVDPLTGRRVFKRGIDIGALPGTQVVATAPGYVVSVTNEPNYGLTIKIKHRYGMKTYYSHLDSARVTPGKKVEKGQVIGVVGRSGSAPIYMLYYEVHVGTVAYDPRAFLNYLQQQWLTTPKS